MATGDGSGKTGQSFFEQLPTDQLKHELLELGKAAQHRAMSSLTENVGAAGKKLAERAKGKGKDVASSLPGGDTAKKVMEKGTEAVTDKATEAMGGDGGGGIAKKAMGLGKEMVKDKVKGALPGGGGGDGGGGGSSKVTNIVEEIDVGVPVSVAYNKWTMFSEFPDFMKKVEKVDEESETEHSWRAQILWSHRDWKSTIIDQVPNERIVWKSEGSKGYVDGAITFHELTPNLTKILVVLEYYPQGFFEKTGNLWRAPGRRARLELKHFRRHVMTETLLHPEEAEGRQQVIHDSEVSEEQPEQEEQGAQDEPEQQEQQDEPEQQEQQEQQSGQQSG
jgi:uncharacterized membrane protein